MLVSLSKVFDAYREKRVSTGGLSCPLSCVKHTSHKYTMFFYRYGVVGAIVFGNIQRLEIYRSLAPLMWLPAT